MPERAIPVNFVYQFLYELLRRRTLLRKKIAKNPSPIEIIKKSTVILPTCSINKLANVPGSNAVMSDNMIFLNKTYLKLLCPIFV